MQEPSSVHSERSPTKRAAWCFAKASRDLAEARKAPERPVDIDAIVGRLRRLEPGDQRTVGMVVDAYIELSRALTAVGAPEHDPTVAETFAHVARILLLEKGWNAPWPGSDSWR